MAPGDYLRYGVKGEHSSDVARQRPIVVWNCTGRCNLHCVHCYASATDSRQPNELSTEEAKIFIKDLADFNVPVLLFSGGEPLLRDDIFELASFATDYGIKPVLSTNGILITDEIARKILYVGFGEVGISIDGIGVNNDRYRGLNGAYDRALEAIRTCVGLGLRVSLRFTVTGSNFREVPAIFNLIEAENIDRVCFYHLAYVGRAYSKKIDDITHDEMRSVVNLIFDKTRELYQKGLKKEVLTVDNHADGVYLYLKIKRDNPERADDVYRLLSRNGGNNSGLRSNVHADQFWRHYTFGNVRERKFGDIWLDTSDKLMRGLKNRKGLLKGRCAKCHYLDICNGNLRVRAEATYGDIWAQDPACYLTDEEVGINGVLAEV
jgi:radical SAM protein with 4Fe4S-binding SPASM domain